MKTSTKIKSLFIFLFIIAASLTTLKTECQTRNQTNIPLRAAGYKIGGVEYFVAADRRDLTAGQVAAIYKPRWKIETFFKWWKQHLKVYHLIARRMYYKTSLKICYYGLIVQIAKNAICKNLTGQH